MTTQQFLIEANRLSLGQALSLLGALTDAQYAPVGGQIRHVIEFYECFLDGLGSGRIDYDARQRDLSIDGSRDVAAGRVHGILAKLGALTLPGAWPLTVRVEDAPELGDGAFLASSVNRELQVLNSHTIHHFAVVAVTLRSRGVVVDPEFGVAPSTLRHWAAFKIGEAA